ncbi:hypothetical protein BDV95DRAFT_320481 [Massariosphaeria phaeospora]|uniref:Uncharacterized protein n=1 Tax=Massariosphaeria phaeospora TaxID=100035 RepID=A0A7C8MD48_9PLEO|nr:hypothetical protein BDV95DRAFT_320481 [Massariosphaeria phaeospora]
MGLKSAIPSRPYIYTMFSSHKDWTPYPADTWEGVLHSVFVADNPHVAHAHYMEVLGRIVAAHPKRKWRQVWDGKQLMAWRWLRNGVVGGIYWVTMNDLVGTRGAPAMEATKGQAKAGDQDDGNQDDREAASQDDGNQGSEKEADTGSGEPPDEDEKTESGSGDDPPDDGEPTESTTGAHLSKRRTVSDPPPYTATPDEILISAVPKRFSVLERKRTIPSILEAAARLGEELART